MLRVGLTGDLGSGKSTVAKLLAARGAVVFSSDDMGRAMMQPGHAVFAQIVRSFGPKVLSPDGTLDRAALAKLAFAVEHPRVEELNALVHPAVIAEQARLLAELSERDPHAIAVVESALIFTTSFENGSWRDRFDTVICVTAPEVVKVARFVERSRGDRVWSSEETAAAEQDARARLAAQQPGAALQKNCLLLANDGTPQDLELRVEALWRLLLRLESAITVPTS